MFAYAALRLPLVMATSFAFTFPALAGDLFWPASSRWMAAVASAKRTCAASIALARAINS